MPWWVTKHKLSDPRELYEELSYVYIFKNQMKT
jgi:hypothetical protein